MLIKSIFPIYNKLVEQHKSKSVWYGKHTHIGPVFKQGHFKLYHDMSHHGHTKYLIG